MLDERDRRILEFLQADAGISVTDLAARVALSVSACSRRIQRLEESGHIARRIVVLDREKMGEGHVAFVQVKLSDTRSAALDAFNRAAHGVPEIEQCHMIASSFDYLLKVRTTDIAAYRRVLGEQISAMPHVAQTSTFVAMETVKDR